MIAKILRTVIGLPFVLMVWPVSLAFLFICLALHCVWVVMLFVGTGDFNARISWDRKKEGSLIADYCISLITVPYKFIREVWG